MEKLSYKRDYLGALRAARRLMKDKDDTRQVFLIMRALNGPTALRNLTRLLQSSEGRRQVYRRVELVERFSDPEYVASFPAGSVGAAYAAFLRETGYSAAGLADISNQARQSDREDVVAWAGRRMRDIHDVWHILTGYRANEGLGEAALVAFSFGQSGGLGWAFIATTSAVRSLFRYRNTSHFRAIHEGYRHGRGAKWLFGEDYEALMREPLGAARTRLGLRKAERYAEATAIPR